MVFWVVVVWVVVFWVVVFWAVVFWVVVFYLWYFICGTGNLSAVLVLRSWGGVIGFSSYRPGTGGQLC